MTQPVGAATICLSIGSILAQCLVASRALAYRPLATEDAGVAGRGVMQLEVSWDYVRWGPAEYEHILLLVPIIGVTDRLELSMETPYMVHEPGDSADERGLGDLNFVGKYLVVKEHGSWPSLALKTAVKTSIGNEDKGLGSGDQDVSVVGVASKTLGDMAWHAMAGYTLIGDNGNADLRDIVLFGIAGDYTLSARWHVLTEVSGNRHPDRTVDKDPLSSFLGLSYAFSSAVIVDGGLRFGLNGAMPDWNASFGATIAF